MLYILFSIQLHTKKIKDKKRYKYYKETILSNIFFLN